MKKILIVCICMFLCGCTSKYTLEISNDSFKENIDVVIDKNLLPEKPEQMENGIEIDDRLTPFLNDDTKVFIDNEKAIYKKKVKYLDDMININMSYKYKEEEFLNSNSLNLCFDDAVFAYKDKYYLHATGTFYCLYTDVVEVNIKTNNKVYEHNADKVNGNVYTWTIDKENYNDVDIEISIKKGISLQIIIVYGFFIGAVIGFGIFAFNKFYKKNKQENEI